MSEGGGGGADVSSMTTPSTIVIEETDGRLRAGGDDIANLALWRFGVLWPRARTLGRHTTESMAAKRVSNGTTKH